MLSKGMIVPKLANLKKTDKKVQEICMNDVFGDMILTYETVVRSDKNQTVLQPLRKNDHEDEIKQACMDHFMKIAPPVVKINNAGAIVLTNQLSFMGATAIFYPQFMDFLAKGCDLLMIPVSMNEWHIIPAMDLTSYMAALEYQNLIKEQCNIPENMFLSDHIYKYEAQKQAMYPL